MVWPKSVPNRDKLLVAPVGPIGGPAGKVSLLNTTTVFLVWGGSTQKFVERAVSSGLRLGGSKG